MDPKATSVPALWLPAINALRQPADGDPKKHAAWHIFMHKHSARIAKVFEAEKNLPENAEKAAIALRTEIAKQLLAKADRDEIENIENTIKTEYEEKVAEQTHLQTAEPSDPTVQKKYVRSG